MLLIEYLFQKYAKKRIDNVESGGLSTTLITDGTTRPKTQTMLDHDVISYTGMLRANHLTSPDITPQYWNKTEHLFIHEYDAIVSQSIKPFSDAVHVYSCFGDQYHACWCPGS